MSKLLELTFPNMTFPLASNKADQGFWTRYETLAQHNVTTLTVTPILSIETFSFGNDPMEIDRKLDLYFDPTIWDTDVYGLAYTDSAFERAVEAWWHDTIGFPESYGTPSYTEQGMQGGDYVSMELRIVQGTTWWAGFESAHAALALFRKNPILLQQLQQQLESVPA